MNRAGRFLVLAAVIALFAKPCGAQQPTQTLDGPENLGTVDFQTSCKPAVRPLFNRAVALLHSFWYDKAASAFLETTSTDPSCAMAYWGVAMTYYHPLWERPDSASLAAGEAAIHKAASLQAPTARERDYIAALANFYRDADKVDHLARVLAYGRAMRRLHERYPGDREAEIFYALSLLGSTHASPPDPSLTRQKLAGAILTKIFPQEPDHPGVAHYIIHGYDYPALAPMALGAARRYAQIAPAAPHALHMPSHIFTRLGSWDESIASNRAAAAAGEKYGWRGEQLHAMDYLMYAYLQQGRDDEARRLLTNVPAVQATDSNYQAGLFSLGAMPARYALERHQWREAESLELPAGFNPPAQLRWAEAAIPFANGVGAARLGHRAVAWKAAGKLEQVRQTLLAVGDKFWSGQLEAERQAVVAWIALNEGKTEIALKQMRAAASLEDFLGKAPVTPGPILPVRELLADMLMEAKQPRQALIEYRAVLRSSPNRLNALYGAGLAAEMTGQKARAREYYRALLKQCSPAGGDRAELAHARLYLNQKY